MIHRWATVWMLMLSLGIAVPASAQDEPPPDTTMAQIGLGETVAGALTAESDTLTDGSRYRPYYFAGVEGDEVSLFLESTDFDATLLLLSGENTEEVLESDADGGGNCNAHVSMALPASGEYIVVVTAAEAGEAGQYQLTLMQGMQPAASQAPCQGYTGIVGTLSLGDTVAHALGEGDRVMGNGSYFQVWTLENPQHLPFTIDLNSDDFDAALILVRGIREAVVADDDSGDGGCNARIPHNPPDDRPLRIVVVSRGERTAGSYRLSATEGLSALIGGNTCQIGP